MERKTHSIRIKDEIWKEAKASGLNVSKFIEENLQRVSTSKKQGIMKELLFCRACHKTKPSLDDFWGIVSSNEENESTFYLICDDCVTVARNMNQITKLSEQEDIMPGEEQEETKKLFLGMTKYAYEHNKIISSNELKALLDNAATYNFMYFEFGKGCFDIPTESQLNKLKEARPENLGE